MKLRNKRTGEIRDVESLGHEKSLRDKHGPQITLSWNTEYENLGECRTYNSLAELNEEWEDYEEPKRHWIIDTMNDRVEDFDAPMVFNESIGNYFDTREEAEKAVEKLKAWQRLKDKGFRFIDHIDRDNGQGITRYKWDGYINNEDLDLLFGGEE